MKMRVGTLLCVLALVGCAGPSGEAEDGEGASSTGEQPGTKSTGLRLEMKVEPRVLEPGESISIELTVLNPGPEPISVSFNSGCLYGFGLWNQDGELVAPESPICTMNAPIIRYEPGEVVKRSFRWEWDGRQLAPGVYEFRAGLGRRGQIESAPPVGIRLR